MRSDSCTGCHKPADGAGSAATPEASGTATSGGQTAGPAAIPHPIDGDTYKDCTTCHGTGGIKPFPTNHTAFAADSCTGCHKPAEGAGSAATPEASGTATSGGQTAGPAAIPHPIDGDAYKDCTTCHGTGGIKPFPTNHTAFAADSCTGCHKPAEGGATSGAGSTGGSTAAAPAIPANHDLKADVFKDCATCHGLDKLKPYPENHTAFKLDQCQSCHQQAQ